MSEGQHSIAMMDSDDGVLILGPENKLSALDQHQEFTSRRPSSATLSRAGDALGAVAGLQASSGRWVKLDSDSASLLKTLGISSPQAGVVRGESGRILKHLKFENAALLTPAAPAALSAMATQAALEAALDDIQKYLASIEAKLDQLLKQRKVEVLGQLGGVSLSIDEAHALYTRTGKVSAVTWSKVQTNSVALTTMQAEAVAQLDALAEKVAEQVGNTDGSAKVLTAVPDDATFWLGILAKTLALQDRQYAIELARVAEDDADHLESHHEGIKDARAARAQKISQRLEAIRSSVSECADLSDLDRVANPFNAKRVTQGANTVNQTITSFAEHASLGLTEQDVLESVAWRSAAKAVIGDVGSRAGAAGGQVADQASGLRDRLRARRESALRTKLEKLESRRRERGAEATPEELEEKHDTDQD